MKDMVSVPQTYSQFERDYTSISKTSTNPILDKVAYLSKIDDKLARVLFKVNLETDIMTDMLRTFSSALD